MPDERDNRIVLLTDLEREQGLCPVRSRCQLCANVDYIYFTGVVCRLEKRKIARGGTCESHVYGPAAAEAGKGSG